MRRCLKNLKDRIADTIEYQFEVIGERVVDIIHKIRKPLMIIAAITVLITIRSARKRLKGSTNTSDFFMGEYGSSPSDGDGDGGSSYSEQDMPYFTPDSASSTTTYVDSNSYGSSSYGDSAYGSSSYGTGASSYGTGGTSSYGDPNAYGSSSYGSTGGSAYGATSNYGDTSSYGSTSYGSSSYGLSSTAQNPTADLADRYGSSVQVLQLDLKDYTNKKDFSGSIETVNSFESASTIDYIVREAGNGRVLVIDGGGSHKVAIFTSEMASNAANNGWSGIIVNGCIRGLDKISSMSNIGIKALCVSPMKGNSMQQGRRGESISFGGVQFMPNTWVYADMDGVLVSQQSIGNSYGGGTSYGGSTSYGTAGSTSYGNGASSYGTGASTSYGTGASSYGMGASSSYGTGASSYGAGASTSYGTGASSYGDASYGNTGGTSYGATASYGDTSSSYGTGGSSYGGASTSSYGNNVGNWGRRYLRSLMHSI